MNIPSSKPRLAGQTRITLTLITLVALFMCCLCAAPNAQADNASASGPTMVAAKKAKAKEYIIVYKLKGGKQAAGQVKTIRYGKTIKVKKLKNPKRTYYNFLGWYKDKALKKKAKVIKGSPNAAKRTLYAKWQRKTYKIVYKLGGGTNHKKQRSTIKGGQTIATSKLKAPTKTGYTFVAWCKDKALKKKAKAIKGTATKANRTLYAKWKATKYKINYELNGGTLSGSYAKTYTVETTIKFPKPTRSGYTFMGWYENAKLSTQADSSTKKLLGDITLHAKWQPIDYDISYEPNGGTMPENYARTYNAETPRAELPIPYKAGYSFIGWYADENLSEIVTSIDASNRGNVKLYARWHKRVLVAHRGITANAPENSSKAFEDAAALGFEEVELDVRFTKDEVPVLIHDEALNLADVDENGQFVRDEDGKIVYSLIEVNSLTFDELQAAKFKNKKKMSGSDGKNLATFDEGMATLEELGMNATIHLKTTDITYGQLSVLLSIVEEHGLQDNVRWATDEIDALRYIRAADPDAALLYHRKTASAISKTAIADALELAETGEVAINLRYAYVTTSKLALCKNAGIPMATWNFNDETELAGVDQYFSYLLVDDLVADSVPDPVEF